MTFTEKQLKELWDAEIHFDNVVNRSCIRNAPEWLTKKIISIYEDATGETVKYKMNCPSCVMNIYRMIGKIYFADLKELNELKSSIEPLSEVTPDKIDESEVTPDKIDEPEVTPDKMDVTPDKTAVSEVTPDKTKKSRKKKNV